MKPDLIVYVGQDVGTSKVLFVTTDNAEGRAAWLKFKQEKDLRFPEIHKFECKDWQLFEEAEKAFDPRTDYCPLCNRKFFSHECPHKIDEVTT